MAEVKLRVCLLVTALVTVSMACDFPPSLWCSSSEMAKLCNVETQCKELQSTRTTPVNLALYFESECMACKAFTTNQLYTVWKELGSDVLNITLVPYGNAKEKNWFGKWKYTCQHGQDECVGNLIETCAMYLMKNFSDYFPFIHCIEAQQWTAPAAAADHCAKKMKIDMSKINDCANGDLGNGLLHQMALETAALNPPHTYVPWLTFNGIHDVKIETKALNDLLPVVCDMYQVETQCKELQSTRTAPVNLALYFESECMACKAFTTNQLYTVWKELGSDVLNITLVPYGNAKEKNWFGKWKYTCQHGQDECVGNLIETCAMYLMKNFSDYFPFIHCIEAQQWTAPAAAADHCAKKMKIDMSKINDCANGDLGNGLLHQMALETAALNPPHTYVPWLTFNGIHDVKIETKALNDLLPVVCDMYQGPKPPACSKLETRLRTNRCIKDV